jgi:hypothetical protein
VSKQNAGDEKGNGCEEPFNTPHLDSLPVQYGVCREDEPHEQRGKGAAKSQKKGHQRCRRKAECALDMVKLQIARPTLSGWATDPQFSRAAAHMTEGSTHDELRPAVSTGGLYQRMCANGSGDAGRSHGRLPKIAFRVMC